MYRFLHRIVQKVLEVFMPGIAAALKAEGQFSLTDPSRSGEQDPSAYIDIEDNGADTTLITFAGMAVLYAAMPKFEFKKVLQEGGGHYNFIFVRDIYRSSYRLAPDGSADGIAFYERIISEAVQQLGAKHTIAIGMSGGAEAAFRISGASPIDRILAFNPAFPMEHYGSWSNIARVILNIRKLVGKPGAYFETLFVTLGTIYLHRRNLRLVGYEKPESPLRDYLRRAAPAVLFYSRYSIPDFRQARALKDVTSITLQELEASRHNCFVEMKKKGTAGKFIGNEIRKQVSSCLKTEGK